MFWMITDLNKTYFGSLLYRQSLVPFLRQGKLHHIVICAMARQLLINSVVFKEPAQLGPSTKLRCRAKLICQSALAAAVAGVQPLP